MGDGVPVGRRHRGEPCRDTRCTKPPSADSSRRSATWRGDVQPTAVAAFFASCRNMVNHYADIAAQGGAWLLVIGSEMSSVQGETAQWREVAHQARSRFSGLLTYSPN